MSFRTGILLCALTSAAAAAAAEPLPVVLQAQAAEARFDCRTALALYLQADQAKPGDVVILQKIARQYSDLVMEQTTDERRREFAAKALDYAQRAVALDPNDPVSVLSLAVSHGKLAIYSDIRTKVKYVRLVHDETVRALELDPRYAWAHNILGHWNYEVASLGPSARFFLRLFFGGLPDASFDAAIGQLRRATELEPGELSHWLELGFAYSRAGRTAEARTAWEHGLAMPTRNNYDEPSKKDARAALARLGPEPADALASK